MATPVGIVNSLPERKVRAKKKDQPHASNADDALDTHPLSDDVPGAPGTPGLGSAREQGNDLFRAGNYAGAVAKYDEAIAANANDAAALANRAECYLRCRQFHLALADATRAYAADANHVKALYKRAMALNGMGRYAEAIKTLKTLAELAPEDDAAAHALMECEHMQAQAFTGTFEVPALLFGRQATSFRRCADYVGPIKIARGGAVAHGRGLVTTRDVVAGELLCVSSPLAVAPLATGGGAEMGLIRGLVGAASRNPEDLRLILALPASAKDDPATAPVPDMSLFRRHLRRGDEVEANSEVPSQELFATHSKNVVTTSAIRNEKSVGVYPLMSFANHSCAPNACKLLIGHTMFTRAARDLVAGEEVCVKYFDVTAPKSERNAVAKRWGFECACARCGMEAIGEVSANRATKAAAKAAASARETAKKDPKNKKTGGDRDGDRAAAIAAAAAMEKIEVKDVASLIAVCRAKSKALHDDIARALAEWKRTKGKSPAPDPNQLVELATWFETACDGMGLSPTRAAWARGSVLQLYANIGHCFTASGQLEARAELLDKVSDTIALLDPGSFEHCKQVAAAVGNARRAFGGPDAKRLVDAAEAKAAAVHAIRYGCGGTASEEDVAVALELVKRTEHSNEESQGEFCEA